MRNVIAATLSLLTALTALAAAGEDTSTRVAKQALKDNQDAIVWVSAVAKSHMAGQGAMMGNKQEHKIEIQGTVIDPSGLTVVSASMLDPMSLLSLFMEQMGDQNADQMNFAVKSDIANIKLHLADGKEIPAQLVLTDPDLDLSFLLPEKKEGQELPKFTHVKLEAAAKPQILDEIISIGRLGKSLDRQPWVVITRISATVSKPRAFYLLSNIDQNALGTPVFAMDAKPVGILILRKSPGASGAMGMMSMAASQIIAPVILPAADILEIAAQAIKKAPTAGAQSAPADQPATDQPAPADKPENRPAGKTENSNP